MHAGGTTGADLPSREIHWQRPYLAPADSAEILLVRHGTSGPESPELEHEFTPDGWGDPALAPEGREQARTVAARLESVPIAALFVTPLRRTVETAHPLAERTGLAPRVVRELSEVHMGEWEGAMHRIRIAENDSVWQRVLREERWDAIPGAERMEQFSTRVRTGMEKVASKVGAGNLGVAFVHGGVIGEVCRQASGSRPFAFVYADNGSITRIICRPEAWWQVHGFNDVSHLPTGVRAG
jgi:2,3-bisphosphoglycerate-dependent phosphoglycerate mutase